jgi:hypothetical protein
MSAEQDRVRAMAERIAERVSQSESREQERPVDVPSDELTEVRESLAELQRKLSTIEDHLARERDDASPEDRPNVAEREAGPSRQNQGATRPPTFAHSPWLSGVYVPAAHPSQERFGVEEAAVSELVDFFFEKEKVCELEPGGKPCTHCDMCSTRGF